MTEYCVNSFFDEIAKTSGRKDKIKLIRSVLDREIPEFVFAVRLALDPFIRFGFKKMPKIDETVQGEKDFKDCIVSLNLLSGMNHSNESEEFLKRILSDVKPSERPLIRRIVLKDLRCGMNVATWNEAIKGRDYEEQARIRDYPCMLASPYSEKLVRKLPWEDGVFCQEKCDGMRFNAVINNGTVKYFGRSGKPLSIPSVRFEAELLRLASSMDVVFDGELLVLDKDGNICDRKTGNGILNKAVRGTITKEESDRIIFTVWDMIPYDCFVSSGAKKSSDYKTRFNRLSNLFTMTNEMGLWSYSMIRLVRSEVIHSIDEANNLFKEITDRGGEGVMLKDPRNVWRNARATDQVKMKLELDADLRVVEVQEGSGKYEGMLGALVLESDDGKIHVSVGTGFDDNQRKTLLTNEIVGRIATVVYNCRIKDKNRIGVDSLFLPRFVELRSDKSETNRSEDIK